MSDLEGGEPLLIEHVPALICDQCGEQAYSGDVLEILERLRREGGAPIRVLSVPVYDFAAAQRAEMAASER